VAEPPANCRETNLPGVSSVDFAQRQSKRVYDDLPDLSKRKNRLSILKNALSGHQHPLDADVKRFSILRPIHLPVSLWPGQLKTLGVLWFRSQA
jgi:hypothetical protein